MLHLLPALPAEWPTGRFRGMRSRGRIELDVEWDGGHVIVKAALRLLHQIDDKKEAFRCRLLSRTPLVWESRRGGGEENSFEARLGFKNSGSVVEGGFLWNAVDVDVGNLLPGEEVRLVAGRASS